MATDLEKLGNEALYISGMRKRKKPKTGPGPATRADTKLIQETMKQQALKRQRRGAYATKGQKKAQGQLLGAGPITLADIVQRTGAATEVGKEQLTKQEFMLRAKEAQGVVKQGSFSKYMLASKAVTGASAKLAPIVGSSILRGIGGLGGYLSALGPLASFAGLGYSLYAGYKAKKKKKKQKKQRERAFKQYQKSFTVKGGSRRSEGDTSVTGGETI